MPHVAQLLQDLNTRGIGDHLSLLIRDAPVDDSGIQKINSCPFLSNVILINTNVSESGAKTLSRHVVVTLITQSSGNVTRASFKSVES